MKRDMDLCRKILLKIEKINTGTAIYDLPIAGYNKQVAYHCQMLHEAGFIDGYKAQYGDNELVFFCVGSITWAGNEYLNQIRDDNIWDKVKASINEKVLSITFDKVKSIAMSTSIELLNREKEGVKKSV